MTNLRRLFQLGGQGSGNFGHSGRPGEVGGSQPRSFTGLAIGKGQRRKHGGSTVNFFGMDYNDKRHAKVKKEHDEFWAEKEKEQKEAERRWKESDYGARKPNPLEDYENVDHSKSYSKDRTAGFPKDHPLSDPNNRVGIVRQAVQDLSYSNLVGFGGALKQASQGKTDGDLYKTFSSQLGKHGISLEDVLKATYFETQGLLDSLGAPDSFSLYHGSSSFKGNYEKTYNLGSEFTGFSSWSSDDSTAAGFGSHVLFSKVPKERILVFPAQVPKALPGMNNPLGFLIGGQRNEKEYIVASDDFFSRIGL